MRQQSQPFYNNMFWSARKRPIRFIGTLVLLAADPTALLSVTSFDVSLLSPKPTTVRTSTLSESKLIPEGNPEANPDIESRSGVRYGDVLAGLNQLFAPDELDKRNAKSRSDGYWPYISEESGPPQEFTYGEFDFFFFAELLDRAHVYMPKTDNSSCKDWSGKTFVDIGSGMGRLVVAAAALHPSWKVCRGIEVLEGIHHAAEETLEKCRSDNEQAPQQEYRDSPKRNELWIPSLHAPDTNFKPGGRPVFSAISEEDWFGDLQRQVLREDSDEGEGVSESDESIINANDDIMDENPDTIGDDEITDTTKSMNEDGNLGANEEGAKNGPKHVLLMPPDNFTSTDLPRALPLAPIEFVCGSFEDPFVSFTDAGIVFVFSSAFPKHAMDSLGRSIGTKCKPGTIVVTIDYMLQLEGVVEPCVSEEYGFDLPSGRYKLELVEETDGWCWLTGGLSTAFIYCVQVSLWEQQEKIKGPNLQDKAFQAVKAAEAEKLANAERFLTGVYNNMVYHGLPESWRPKRVHDIVSSRS